MLADRRWLTAPTMRGRRIVSCRRQPSASPDSSSTCSQTTTNPSLPSRATVSAPRTIVFSRWPSCTSTASPVACPCASLTCLKLLRAQPPPAPPRCRPPSARMTAMRSARAVRTDCAAAIWRCRDPSDTGVAAATRSPAGSFARRGPSGRAIGAGRRRCMASVESDARDANGRGLIPSDGSHRGGSASREADSELLIEVGEPVGELESRGCEVTLEPRTRELALISVRISSPAANRTCRLSARIVTTCCVLARNRISIHSW